MPNIDDAIRRLSAVWDGDDDTSRDVQALIVAVQRGREVNATAVPEIERLHQALSDIQFDLINCSQAAGSGACEHLQDAIKIVNRTLKEG